MGNNLKLSGQNLTPIGVTNWRNENIPFGIKDIDRFGHIYVLGKTGVGKSTLLLTMAISDIERRNGLTVIDPHGDVAEKILKHIPNYRHSDLIYLNPAEETQTMTFNPLFNVDPKFYHLVASGLISTFKRIWEDSWGPRLEYILNMSLLTLLRCPNATLLDISPLLSDAVYRTRTLSFIQDNRILSFWKSEFEKYTPSFRSEVIAPILNKMGIFNSSDPLKRIVGAVKGDLNIQEIMDTGKILIVNLSKGKIGEQAASILGSIIINSIQLGALHRSYQPEELRRPFYLYVDEVHSFVSLAFADILSEARKYKLSIFMAHQYISQLHEKIRSAIFGNVGTMLIFRIGGEDSEFLEKEFYPYFSKSDFVGLPKYSMYLKLMIDGVTSKPFSANTIKR